jgi:hypothetical protein
MQNGFIVQFKHTITYIMRERERERNVCLGSRGLLHEMEEIGGGLNGLGDLIGHRGFGRAFSAVPTGR